MEELIVKYGLDGGIIIAMVYALKYIFDKYARANEQLMKVVENNTKVIAEFSSELREIRKDVTESSEEYEEDN